MLLAVALAGCGGQMTQSELADSLETIESSTNEAALAADGATDDRSKTTFVRVYAREISEKLDHEAEKLSDAGAGEDVGTDKQKAINLIDEISAQVDKLQVAPQDQAAAEAARDRLKELADEVSSLKEHL